MIEAFVPSLIIVFSVTAAFLAGRVVAFLGRRIAPLAFPLRIGASLVSVGLLLLFATNGSSRYALLLPIAFAAGVFVRRAPVAPSVFRS